MNGLSKNIINRGEFKEENMTKTHSKKKMNIGYLFYLIFVVPSIFAFIYSLFGHEINQKFWGLYFIQFVLAEIWGSFREKKIALGFLQLFVYISSLVSR